MPSSALQFAPQPVPQALQVSIEHDQAERLELALARARVLGLCPPDTAEQAVRLAVARLLSEPTLTADDR